MYKNKIYLPGLILILCMLCVGCATGRRWPRPKKISQGVYHRVERGQTLWRIAKIYNVELDRLVGINKISDSTKIEVGQLIFIPGARKKIKVASVQVKAVKDEEFSWPLRGKLIAYFGRRYGNIISKGIDVKARLGQTVYAARSGKVVFSKDTTRSYGKTLIIDHGDGFSSLYSSNSDILVNNGEWIAKGKPIARVGMTKQSQTPHLHFEIRKGHVAHNPLHYLP